MVTPGGIIPRMMQGSFSRSWDDRNSIVGPRTSMISAPRATSLSFTEFNISDSFSSSSGCGCPAHEEAWDLRRKADQNWCLWAQIFVTGPPGICGFHRCLNTLKTMPILVLDRGANPPTDHLGAPQGPRNAKVASRGLCKNDDSCSFV